MRRGRTLHGSAPPAAVSGNWRAADEDATPAETCRGGLDPGGNMHDRVQSIKAGACVHT